jgi:hypothetical protein
MDATCSPFSVSGRFHLFRNHIDSIHIPRPLMKAFRFHFARHVTAPRTILALFCLSGISAFAAPVDLNTWTPQNYSANAGNWSVQGGGATVLQTLNGNPTVFLSNQSALGTEIQGKIKVETSGDDDFIGFVLGFSAGDFSNAGADYLLIDWKQNTQGGFGTAGLAVSRVTGVAPAATNFALHNGAVTELARGATLGATGWTDNVEYTFGFTFTPTNLQVTVNGIQQINLNGNFSDGNLGFYNYSQSNVRYSGFTQDVLPPPPPTPNGVPDGGATAPLLAAGLFSLVALSRRRARA